MRRCTYACGSGEHDLSRRRFLGSMLGTAAGAGALGGMSSLVTPASAAALQSAQKRVLVFFLAGGVSQLESWDPKPGTSTGGPFRAIPTSVPGVHISELLPYTAKQMHRLAIVRSVNTQENSHGKGAYLMQTGRREEPATTYPMLGSAAAKLLAPGDSPVPGYIHITPRGESGSSKTDAAFLGPRYGSIILADGNPPAMLDRPKVLPETLDQQRNDLRSKLNQSFAATRRTAETDAYASSFEQASQLMQRREIFDLSKESPHDRERYGNHEFGRHCLLARRLLEQGVTFVKVTHSNYDTHYENFDFHIEQLGEFDRTFSTMIEDLAQRGMLDSTLVIVMSEFGRTPTINRNYGRDHWGTAWSVALSGCGIQPGAVIGKTNAGGTAVADRQVDHTHLYHTYFTALGLDPKKNYHINGRPIPMADPKGSVISELLS